MIYGIGGYGTPTPSMCDEYSSGHYPRRLDIDKQEPEKGETLKELLTLIPAAMVAGGGIGFFAGSFVGSFIGYSIGSYFTEDYLQATEMGVKIGAIIGTGVGSLVYSGVLLGKPIAERIRKRRNKNNELEQKAIESGEIKNGS